MKRVTWTCPNCGTDEVIDVFGRRADTDGHSANGGNVFVVDPPQGPRPTPPPAAPQLPPSDPTLIGTEYGSGHGQANRLRRDLAEVTRQRDHAVWELNDALARLAEARAALDGTRK